MQTPGDIFLNKNVARNYSCCSLLKAGPKMMMCHLQCAHSNIKPFLRRKFLTRWTHSLPFYLCLCMDRLTYGGMQKLACLKGPPAIQRVSHTLTRIWNVTYMIYTAYDKAQNQMELSGPHRKQNFIFTLETKMAGLAQCVGEKDKNIMVTIWSSSVYQA